MKERMMVGRKMMGKLQDFNYLCTLKEALMQT